MSDNRSCTCHPDEAPKPCQKRYAFSECQAAARIEQLEAALRVIQKLPNVKSHYGTQITEMIDAALEERT